MTRLSWLIATLVVSLFGASAAQAISCSKANNGMERLICSDSHLRQADTAMYAAKTGGGGVSVYDSEVDARLRERAGLADAFLAITRAEAA